MSNYPAYVDRLLAQAREEGQWYCGQPDAAALCFEVLALFPDHRQASELVYQLFCDEWLIYDNRCALQQHIDEWDDRPWQQRRRLALSFRFMSRWEDKYQEDGRDFDSSPTTPTDVAELLEEGRSRLLDAYCLGDTEATYYAWDFFESALRRTKGLQQALLGVAWLYTDLGFFADAAELLTELCSKFEDGNARRLLAEVRWWRDNAYRIPWIPPPGDGSRYKRMMQFIDPDTPDDEEIRRELRSELGLPAEVERSSALNSDLADAIASAASALADAPPYESPVDWSFLDEDDGQPGELPDWAKKQMSLFPMQADDFASRYR